MRNYENSSMRRVLKNFTNDRKIYISFNKIYEDDLFFSCRNQNDKISNFVLGNRQGKKFRDFNFFLIIFFRIRNQLMNEMMTFF